MTDVSIDEEALTALLEDPDGPVGKDLERRAIQGETAAKRLLSLPGTGREYVRYRPRRVHRASAPGAPPAVDTGVLRASVGHEKGVDEQGVYARWGTAMAVGAYLELGTRYIAPRPFLRPSIDAARE